MLNTIKHTTIFLPVWSKIIKGGFCMNYRKKALSDMVCILILFSSGSNSCI